MAVEAARLLGIDMDDLTRLMNEGMLTPERAEDGSEGFSLDRVRSCHPDSRIVASNAGSSPTVTPG